MKNLILCRSLDSTAIANFANSTFDCCHSIKWVEVDDTNENSLAYRVIMVSSFMVVGYTMHENAL